MKKSGYRTTFHIYFIFLLTLLGTILAAVSLFFLLIDVYKRQGLNIIKFLFNYFKRKGGISPYIAYTTFHEFYVNLYFTSQP